MSISILMNEIAPFSKVQLFGKFSSRQFLDSSSPEVKWHLLQGRNSSVVGTGAFVR